MMSKNVNGGARVLPLYSVIRRVLEYSHEETMVTLMEMAQNLKDGHCPEEILEDYGIEADYVLDLLQVYDVIYHED